MNKQKVKIFMVFCSLILFKNFKIARYSLVFFLFLAQKSFFFYVKPIYLDLVYINHVGRRFRFGEISNQRVVIVMTGLGMVSFYVWK